MHNAQFTMHNLQYSAQFKFTICNGQCTIHSLSLSIRHCYFEYNLPLPTCNFQLTIHHITCNLALYSCIFQLSTHHLRLSVCNL
ncbi:hypothetical protein C1H57_00310 [Clostridium sp. 2-1]|nr:hypothetical protein C1H57_00310 [Clostridium sp. 2-1]